MTTAAPSETFEAMWDWLCYIAESSRADAPLAIHSRSGDRAGWGKLNPKQAKKRGPRGFPKFRSDYGDSMTGTSSVITGLPFSTSFLRRVDHALPASLQDALSDLKPAADTPWGLRAVRRAQYRIVVAVLRDGRVDVEECRGYMRMPAFAFRVAATGGILALRSALDRE